MEGLWQRQQYDGRDENRWRGGRRVDLTALFVASAAVARLPAATGRGLAATALAGQSRKRCTPLRAGLGVRAWPRVVRSCGESLQVQVPLFRTRPAGPSF